jgi:hypothetical protein
LLWVDIIFLFIFYKIMKGLLKRNLKNWFNSSFACLLALYWNIVTSYFMLGDSNIFSAHANLGQVELIYHMLYFINKYYIYIKVYLI